MKSFTLVAVVILSTVLAGCAGNLSGQTYSRNEARQVQHVEYGVVQSAIPVVIEGRQNGVVGTGAGAVVGGIAGSNIGGGKGKDIAAVLGAVAGGIAGQKIEESMTRAQGQEITVRLNSGELISIVQEVNEGQMFQAGDRVRVLRHGGTARVSF